MFFMATPTSPDVTFHVRFPYYMLQEKKSSKIRLEFPNTKVAKTCIFLARYFSFLELHQKSSKNRVFSKVSITLRGFIIFSKNPNGQQGGLGLILD